jgi:hypothetical protein
MINRRPRGLFDPADESKAWREYLLDNKVIIEPSNRIWPAGGSGRGGVDT